ncbi:MAG: phosphohistidine phosphatase SixA [Cyanobacteria bacterium SZAS TMP-1]|nr:phosphohistidine phosphatase SixA [Cyanobacteria bacterium SZAS TMP-1]
MRLFLVRHGIAVDHIGGAITRDSERPLTDEGIAEMKQVARALTKINKKPDLILSSPLVRARQTAEIIAQAFDMEIVLTDSLAPAGSPSLIFKAINKHQGVNQAYLVGHEPDMGMLANKLLWAGVECEFPFKKGAVARIDVGDMPPTGPGTLKWYMPPKLVHSLLS